MRPVVALLLLPLLAPLSGCFTCQPLLDVRHCPPGTDCAPAPDDRVVAWDPGLAALWPDLPVLMEKSLTGEHQHAEWSENQQQAFWDFWDVPAEQDPKRIYFEDGGQTFRVRILSC